MKPLDLKEAKALLDQLHSRQQIFQIGLLVDKLRAVNSFQRLSSIFAIQSSDKPRSRLAWPNARPARQGRGSVHLTYK